MILSNLYKIWGGLYLNDNLIKVRDIDGTERNASGYSPTMSFGYFGTSNRSIYFGYGDTAPDFDDYKLEHAYGTSDIVTNNYLYPTGTYTPSTGLAIKTISFVLTNNRSTALTVKEIGIATSYILLYREVLDNPFTVAAGETIKYTHTLKFTVPTTSDE